MKIEKIIKGYFKDLIQLGPPQNALRGATVVTFACCARMPPILLIWLSQGRIESSDEIAQSLAILALNASFLCAGEHPRVLRGIP